MKDTVLAPMVSLFSYTGINRRSVVNKMSYTDDLANQNVFCSVSFHLNRYACMSRTL